MPIPIRSSHYAENLNLRRSITGIDDRTPVEKFAKTDPLKVLHAKPVAQIYNKYTNVAGIAWRVGAGNHLITNAHVLSSGNPRDYIIEFNDDRGRVAVEGDKLLAYSPRQKVRAYDPVRRVVYWQYTGVGLDYALFSIKPEQFKSVERFGYLGLDVRQPHIGQEIYLPQYNYENDKKVISIYDDARGNPQEPCKIRNFDRYNPVGSVQYTCDSLPGSSGSPVIDSNTNKVVALNNGRNNKQKINVASKLHDLWSEIKQFFNDQLPTSSFEKQIAPLPPQKYFNGILYELKKIPDVGEKWIEVWQGNKKYLKGDVILHKKYIFHYVEDRANKKNVWIPRFESNNIYQSGAVVLHKGEFYRLDIVDKTTSWRLLQK